MCSQSVTCILIQEQRITPQSMIRGGQVRRSFTPTEDEWCRKERLRLSKPSHNAGDVQKNLILASRMAEKINVVVLSD